MVLFLEKKIVFAFFFLTFFLSVQATAMEECLNKNPPDRIVFQFIGEECVQVACLQGEFTTESLPLYCENNQLKKKFYKVTYDFPECKPKYTEKFGFEPNEICELCPDAVILSDYQMDSCINGRKVESRAIETHFGADCTPRTFTEYRLTNEVCYFSPSIDVGNVGWIMLGLLIVVGAVFGKKIYSRFF